MDNSLKRAWQRISACGRRLPPHALPNWSSLNSRKQRFHLAIFELRRDAQIFGLRRRRGGVFIPHLLPWFREVEAAVDRLRRPRQERLQQDTNDSQVLDG